jgi:hypothetical protein
LFLLALWTGKFIGFLRLLAAVAGRKVWLRQPINGLLILDPSSQGFIPVISKVLASLFPT